ncbi:gamma-glutamyl-gamma-aminobutyrate hydrolase family protein [Alicyclobacillaceae bacterium I2511]|nr:gamma-glutamyl-gamma-aminobutyrate hydrolase family protein [Alicyclobacillaceae bacterium I2511]
MKPLIGITGSRFEITTVAGAPGLLGVSLADDYALGVERAGGLPLVIPYLQNPDSVSGLADYLDGLLLAGGEDMDPQQFGEFPQNGLGAVVPERDVLELALLRAMVDKGKPVLGICRGMQVMNVAFGGTLYQDLSRQWRGSVNHRQKARRNHLSHQVTLQPGSRLQQLLQGETEIGCNSFHHQAVNILAPGFIPVAWDPEGLVEGMESQGVSWLVAVQWHPENLWQSYPVFLGLFSGLIEVAQQGHSGELPAER